MSRDAAPKRGSDRAPLGRLILSFDLEDYDQLIRKHLGIAGWDTPSAGFPRQMRALFDLLDGIGARATFFVLGVSVKNYPDLLQEMGRRGDEIALHGYAHEPVYRRTPEQFRADLLAGIELIHARTGRRPVGFRAPAFSINRDSLWAYEVLADLGFRYDSSQNAASRVPRRIEPRIEDPFLLPLESGRELWEFPICTLRLAGRALPIGGGTSWRLLPAALLRPALRRSLAGSAARALYFHPYELDPAPLTVTRPAPVSMRVRIGCLYQSLRNNPGRRGVPRRIRAIARDFHLVNHEYVLERSNRHGGARAGALPEGGGVVR